MPGDNLDRVLRKKAKCGFVQGQLPIAHHSVAQRSRAWAQYDVARCSEGYDGPDWGRASKMLNRLFWNGPKPLKSG